MYVKSIIKLYPMKNLFPKLLLGALALTAMLITSCEKEKELDDAPQYEITLTADSGGKVEAKVDGKDADKVTEGTEVTLTAKPFYGYKFSHWTVESGGITLTGNPATFTMPANDVSIRAEFAEEEKYINVYDKIPDPEFLYYCTEVGKFDTNNDGFLSISEAQAVKEIIVNEWYKVTGNKVQSLAGIEYFTSLTKLSCYGNAITGIDLSKNTALAYLHIGTNMLSELDITKNTKLTELYVSRNPITAIDLAQCPDLEKFECAGCQDLLSLDVSKNPKLTRLAAETCPKLTSLDLSKNPALTVVRCFDGNLTSLNVSNCTELEALNCFDNKIAALDVSKCAKLTVFDCRGNNITSLDVSKATSLDYFMCYKNRIATLDASTMSNPNGFSLGCGVQTTDGTTPQTIKLTLREEQKPHWQYNMVPYQDMNADVELVGGSADIFVKITDPVFKAFCEQFDTNRDGKLSQEEASAVTEINVANKGIASLAGIDYFTGITKLICNNNKLTSLKTTYNIALVELVCNDNQLTELNVCEKIASGKELTTLNCKNNKLTKLSLYGCGKLVSADCQNNLLTELQLSSSRSQHTINCSNNQLTSLDFYQIHSLVLFYCQNNKLTSLNLSNMTTLTSLMCNNNPMTTLNISGCTSLAGVMAYENRLAQLDASDMANPTGFNLFCGNQTSDGTTARTLTLTLRAEQKAYWESTMKDSFMNGNIVLAN